MPFQQSNVFRDEKKPPEGGLVVVAECNYAFSCLTSLTNFVKSTPIF